MDKSSNNGNGDANCKGNEVQEASSTAEAHTAHSEEKRHNTTTVHASGQSTKFEYNTDFMDPNDYDDPEGGLAEFNEYNHFQH